MYRKRCFHDHSRVYGVLTSWGEEDVVFRLGQTRPNWHGADQGQRTSECFQAKLHSRWRATARSSLHRLGLHWHIHAHISGFCSMGLGGGGGGALYHFTSLWYSEGVPWWLCLHYRGKINRYKRWHVDKKLATAYGLGEPVWLTYFNKYLHMLSVESSVLSGLYLIKFSPFFRQR